LFDVEDLLLVAAATLSSTKDSDAAPRDAHFFNREEDGSKAYPSSSEKDFFVRFFCTAHREQQRDMYETPGKIVSVSTNMSKWLPRISRALAKSACNHLLLLSLLDVFCAKVRFSDLVLYSSNEQIHTKAEKFSRRNSIC
jgi:hypothetical protein